jgi:hypothetical protein
LPAPFTRRDPGIRRDDGFGAGGSCSLIRTARMNTPSLIRLVLLLVIVVALIWYLLYRP